MSTADNTSMKLIVMDRRRQVAALRLRRYTVREIQKGLAAPPTDPKQQHYINPKTNQPWSLRTIHKDILMLEQQWREDGNRDYADLKGEQLAGNRELERAAWKANDLDVVRHAQAARANLLGLNAPTKIKGEFTGKDGAPLNPPTPAFDLRNLSLEQLDQLEAIYLSAAAAAADTAGHPEGEGKT